MLYATNTLLLFQSIVWSITFLIAWLGPMLMALSDGRGAMASLPDNGIQFILTSFISFLIGLIPLVFLRREWRIRFAVSLIIIAISWLWKWVLDAVDHGQISLMPGTNLEGIVLYLLVFAGLLFLVYVLTRKRYVAFTTQAEVPNP